MIIVFIFDNALPCNLRILLSLPGQAREGEPNENNNPIAGFELLMARRCFALDLKADSELIAEYEGFHGPGAVWPDVIEHIRATGVEAMEIWRTGDRLFMIAEIAEDYPRPVEVPAGVERWEALMWRFQQPLAHAAEGEKWVVMKRIFSLEEQ